MITGALDILSRSQKQQAHGSDALLLSWICAHAQCGSQGSSSLCFSSTQITDRHILSCLVFYVGARDGIQAHTVALSKCHPQSLLMKKGNECVGLCAGAMRMKAEW